MKEGSIKNLDGLPILIISFFVIKSLVKVFTSNHAFHNASIVGISLFVLVALTYPFNRKVYSYAMGVLLLIGSLDFVSFLAIPTHIELEIGIIKFNIQPFSLIILAIFFFIERKRVRKLMSQLTKMLRPKLVSEEEIKIKEEEMVKFYKKNLAKHNNEYLTVILNDTERDKEARLAAKQLLSERQ